MNTEIYENLAVSLRQKLHEMPELGGEEYETSDFILDTLKSWGIDNAKKIFKTGVVATVGDINKPCTALRADIDGLPVTEKTSLPFKSKNEGKMHACGHDGHSAVMLSVAKFLKDNEKELKNCVKFIFQPAEETDGGALGMIEEGALLNPDVSKIFGFHFWPEIDSGKAEYSFGASFAEAERFHIHINGNGGHGAMPEGVKNCLYEASQLTEKLKAVSENNKNSVVSLCSVNSTGYYNIFADSLVIKGTIRTLDSTTREKIEKEIKDACVSKYGCEIIPEFIFEYPCAVNSDDELNELIKASKKVLGDDNVNEGKCTFAAEDFAFYTKHIKGAHIKIGTDTSFPLHNPQFDIDEKAIKNAFKIFKELCI